MRGERSEEEVQTQSRATAAGRASAGAARNRIEMNGGMSARVRSGVSGGKTCTCLAAGRCVKSETRARGAKTAVRSEARWTVMR